MSDNEKRFVEEYTRDRKGGPAAIRAGYAKSRARQTAYELLQKKEIRDAIDERMKQLTISADEATKNISDIARTRLQDFMIITKVLRSETIRKPLKKVIEEVEKQIAFESEYLIAAALQDKAKTRQENLINDLELNLIRYRIELKHNPKAYRDVQSEPKWVERMEFDLVALARAYEEGNIMEFAYGEFGPKIKMYAADRANELILKLNGLLSDRMDVTSKGESLNKGFLGFLKKVNKAGK